MKSDLNIDFGALKYSLIVHMSFLLEGFLLYQTNKVFLTFIKMIADITILLWNIG